FRCNNLGLVCSMHPRRVKFDSDVLNTNSENSLLQFVNCSVLRADGLRKEHIWVRNGRILDEKLVFFEEKRSADVQVDCDGLILSPGFIDVQLNGGFGIDFSTYNSDDEQYKKGVKFVAKHLLAHGVTSFAPTVITSSPDTYHKNLKGDDDNYDIVLVASNLKQNDFKTVEMCGKLGLRINTNKTKVMRNER
uniref:N-acetylglucosamine-6-phosphate deacetylase n=2 Tax=Caenorhabditis japonica TaxID=281687 RepID=A0A8R1E5T7_CAEJA